MLTVCGIVIASVPGNLRKLVPQRQHRINPGLGVDSYAAVSVHRRRELDFALLWCEKQRFRE